MATIGRPVTRAPGPLKLLRQRLGLERRELASLLGTSENTLRVSEYGRPLPPPVRVLVGLLERRPELLPVLRQLAEENAAAPEKGR